MSIEWSDELLTGSEAIDRQHRELFGHFEQFSSACEAGKGVEELLELLTFLDEYVRDHFRFEEALMERSAYPGLEIQREQHLKFMEELAELAGRVGLGLPARSVVIGMKGKMIRFLINHVRNLDGKLGEYLRERPEPQ